MNVRTELAPENESILRGASREPAGLEGELHQLEARFTLARQQAGLNTSRESKAVSLAPPSLRAVQAMLPKATVLVEFSVLPDSLTAFIVTKASSLQILWKAPDDRSFPKQGAQSEKFIATSEFESTLESKKEGSKSASIGSACLMK